MGVDFVCQKLTIWSSFTYGNFRYDLSEFFKPEKWGGWFFRQNEQSSRVLTSWKPNLNNLFWPASFYLYYLSNSFIPERWELVFSTRNQQYGRVSHVVNPTCNIFCRSARFIFSFMTFYPKGNLWNPTCKNLYRSKWL